MKGLSLFLRLFIVNLCAAGASAGKLAFLQSERFWIILAILSLILIARWLRKQARRGSDLG